MVLKTGEGCSPRSGQSRVSSQGWGRDTHNGCTEGLEGVGPTCIEVGGIEPL